MNSRLAGVRWLFGLSSGLALLGCEAETADKPSDAADTAEAGDMPDAPLPETEDASAISDAASADDGTTMGKALPQIALTRSGALGFCIEPGQALSVSIDSSSGAPSLSATVFRGWKEACTAGASCMLTESVGPRALTPAEIERIELGVAKIPSGDCHEELLVFCDPCIFSELTIDDVRLPFGGCVHELCTGYNSSATRLSAVLDLLASNTVPAPDPEGCIAPGANLDSAYAPGVKGCSCDYPHQGVCAEGVALICEYSTDAMTHWTAVIDGPCWPRTCSEEQRVGSLAACLENAVLCYDLRDGQYCME